MIDMTSHSPVPTSQEFPPDTSPPHSPLIYYVNSFLPIVCAGDVSYRETVNSIFSRKIKILQLNIFSQSCFEGFLTARSFLCSPIQYATIRVVLEQLYLVKSSLVGLLLCGLVLSGVWSI